MGGKENSNVRDTIISRPVKTNNDNIVHLNHTFMPFTGLHGGIISTISHEITNLSSKICLINCDKQWKRSTYHEHNNEWSLVCTDSWKQPYDH